jgi:hypothetical protein
MYYTSLVCKYNYSRDDMVLLSFHRVKWYSRFVYKYMVREHYGNYFIIIYYVYTRSDCPGQAA